MRNKRTSYCEGALFGILRFGAAPVLWAPLFALCRWNKLSLLSGSITKFTLTFIENDMNEKEMAENVFSCERDDVAFCCPKDRCITVYTVPDQDPGRMGLLAHLSRLVSTTSKRNDIYRWSSMH